MNQEAVEETNQQFKAMMAFNELITNEIEINDLRKILLEHYFHHNNMILHHDDIQHKNTEHHLHWLSRIIDVLDGKIQG